MPSELSIRFALTTHEGEPRYRELSRLDPARVAVGVARSPSILLAGGYVFVRDGGIWNHEHAGFPGARPALYDPADVRADLDTVRDALRFLEAAQLVFDQQGSVTTSQTEMCVVRIKRWQGHREVLLLGLGHDGKQLYPTLRVELARLWDELLGASESFVRFARELEREVAILAPGGAAAWRRDLAREAWEGEAQRLRARLA